MEILSIYCQPCYFHPLGGMRSNHWIKNCGRLSRDDSSENIQSDFIYACSFDCRKGEEKENKKKLSQYLSTILVAHHFFTYNEIFFTRRFWSSWIIANVPTSMLVEYHKLGSIRNPSKYHSPLNGDFADFFPLLFI